MIKKKKKILSVSEHENAQAQLCLLYYQKFQMLVGNIFQSLITNLILLLAPNRHMRLICTRFSFKGE
jgi:hypothetical protein